MGLEKQRYKVFFGEKCIEVSDSAQNSNAKDAIQVNFTTAQQLHEDLQRFYRGRLKNKLVISGDQDRVWRVFRSFFKYIEAAGGLVRNKEGKLLMIYRNRHWDLPKGKLEKGESPALAAVREVEEECGIGKLKITGELPFTHHAFVQEGRHCLKRTYWFEMDSADDAEPVPQKEEGIQKAEWIDKKRMGEVKRKVYDSLKEVLNYF